VQNWKPRLQRLFIYWFATGGFVGFVPLAPGTMGSLVGLGIVWLMGGFPWWVLLLLAVVLCGVGIWSAQQLDKILGVNDSGHIVIDEIVGILITMVGIPVTGYWMFWGFMIFRLLDIVKIPPGNYFDERMKNGWGVMMDDVTAGIYGNLLLQLMLRAQL